MSETIAEEIRALLDFGMMTEVEGESILARLEDARHGE